MGSEEREESRAGLTTHILDTVRGIPAANVRVELFRVADDGSRRRLLSAVTNGDGRVDQPLLDASTMAIGRYEIEFHVAEYFQAAGYATADPPYLGTVPVRFAIADAGAHYHVPLLCSPWSYSTYRGS